MQEVFSLPQAVRTVYDIGYVVHSASFFHSRHQGSLPVLVQYFFRYILLGAQR